MCTKFEIMLEHNHIFLAAVVIRPTETEPTAVPLYTLSALQMRRESFNRHFPGQPGHASGTMSSFLILLKLRMTAVVVTTGAIKRAKLQSNCHHQQTNTQLFTGRMPFLSPNQQYQNIGGKSIIFYRLAQAKLTWGLPTLSLTMKGSQLPRERLPSSSTAL